MVIYLEGPHGIRIAYTDQEAISHEKDGYKRIDINKRKKPRKKRAKNNDQPRTI